MLLSITISKHNKYHIYFLLKMVLQEGLEEVKLFFQRDNCRIPLSPSLVAKDLNIKVSAYHSHSNANNPTQFGKIVELELSTEIELKKKKKVETLYSHPDKHKEKPFSPVPKTQSHSRQISSFTSFKMTTESLKIFLYCVSLFIQLFAICIR